MNTDKWTIVHKTKAPESLQSRFPMAVSHDGVNKVYVAWDESLEAVDLSPINDESTLLTSAAKALVDETAILLRPEQAQFLFLTPHHRLWCGRYEEDLELLREDYAAVTGKTMPEGFDPKDGRELIYAIFA